MLIYPSFQQVFPLGLYIQQMQPLVVSDSTSSIAFKPAIDAENEIPGLDQTPTEYDPDDVATFSVIPAVSPQCMTFLTGTNLSTQTKYLSDSASMSRH